MSDDLKRWRVSVTFLDGETWETIVRARFEEAAAYAAAQEALVLEQEGLEKGLTEPIESIRVTYLGA